MHDIHRRLSTLSRPRLLVRAARHATTSYVRDRHLPRLLGRDNPPKSVPAALELLQLESDLDEKRRDMAADYSTGRHVDVLTALMCEAALVASHEPAVLV